YLDSYTFSWAAHGPMAYMHYRLLANPELDIDTIRAEYFDAFGPAAEHVREYFDYWEAYARDREPIGSVASGDVHGALEKLKRPRGHFLAYPPKVFRPAKAMLGKALAAANQHPRPEFAERVRFLQAGLEHAELTMRLHRCIDYAGRSSEVGSAPVGDPAMLAQARRVMQAIVAFRRQPEHRFVADYISNALVEQIFIENLDALLIDAPAQRK